MMKYITTGLLSFAIVAFLSLGYTVFSTENSTGEVHKVGMTDGLKYDPKTIKIKVGDQVVWKNSSVLVHTVTCDPSKTEIDKSVNLPEGAEPFDSGRMDPDVEFKHTFEVPGRYVYFCIPHEAANMVGEVIVE